MEPWPEALERVSSEEQDTPQPNSDIETGLRRRSKLETMNGGEEVHFDHPPRRSSAVHPGPERRMSSTLEEGVLPGLPRPEGHYF